ncbi:hypothetical protein BX285_3921 [Streptomyces sp. 1114.5]|uniref:hypothetical protein n=1 Tax=unclassified Streptomyces TaxID=2593676 RepID=UPI000BD6B60B|nr:MULTISPECIES: hypothetical protein [unclassified Streptomyces]RKT19463.1 hypothetical protein BX285_3921 [Streptomyces sp. 1114.5]SOB85659.1 hypothetical protein SAMN06272789_5950 [Streptomyces sp. 1331.2]
MQRIQKSVPHRLAFLVPAALAAVLAVLGTVADTGHSGDTRPASSAERSDKGTSEFNTKA